MNRTPPARQHPQRLLRISRHLESVRPPDGVTAILPNRQAARSIGVPYLSLDELAARVLQRSGRHVAPALIRRRLLQRAAFRAGATEDASGFARAAEATVRELLRADVDMATMKSSGSSRMARLADMVSHYLSLMRTDGYVDPAELLWRAAESSPQRMTVCVSGFPRLPAAERAFLGAIAGTGSTIHLPLAEGPLFDENREAVDDLLRSGWSRSQAEVETPEPEPPSLGARLASRWLSNSLPGAEVMPFAPALVGNPGSRLVEAHAYPDLDAEARGTLAAVKGLLLEGVGADQIAVVARDDVSYGPTLMAVANEFGVPLRVLYQVPLAETRLGAWLTNLLEVVGGDFEFEATARLLAHPLAAQLSADAWRAARESHPSGKAAWQELVPGFTASWPSVATRKSYVRILLALLDALTVRRNAVRWPREAAAFATLSDELRVLPDGDREVPFETFAAEVAELTALLTVPAHPGKGGVELHTPLSLFGVRVDHLFVVGAAEGHLPSPVRPDPVFDPFEREQLKAARQPIETVSTAAYREETSFWALLYSVGSSLTVSFPALLGRSETLASPFIARLGLEPAPPPARPLCSLPELRRAQLLAPGAGVASGDEVLERARAAHAVESRREADSVHDSHDGIVGVPYDVPFRGVGVTRLIQLASCPFRFFASTVLRLAEPDEATDELEPSIRGKLYHRVLQLALEAARGHDDPRAAALAGVAEAFARTEEELQLQSLKSWPLERDDHLELLRRAIRGEDFMRSGASVLELETEFQANWLGIPVRGRVDRIDRGPDGLTFVDYKSGGSLSGLAKGADGRASVDLQLPVYREAASILVPGEEVAETIYYSISRAEAIRVKEPTGEELEHIAGAARRAWEQGAYPVDPDLQEHACRYCEFDALCRKGPRLERKRNRT